MTASFEANFKRLYDTHLKHLTLKGLQPKTIEAYARAIRRIGAYFEYQLEKQRQRGHKVSFSLVLFPFSDSFSDLNLAA